METDNLNCNEAPIWFIDALDRQENEVVEVGDQSKERQKDAIQSLGFV